MHDRLFSLEATKGVVAMPLAQIYVPQGALTLEQRRAMIKGVTDVIASVEKLPPSARPYVTLLINEVPDGGWRVAGHGYAFSEIPELIQKGARTDPDAPR
jgi:4-oxalocrotonate tautomerase family enzyme